MLKHINHKIKSRTYHGAKKHHKEEEKKPSGKKCIKKHESTGSIHDLNRVNSGTITQTFNYLTTAGDQDQKQIQENARAVLKNERMKLKNSLLKLQGVN